MNMPTLRRQILDDDLKVLEKPVEMGNSRYAPIPLAVLMVGERLTFDLYLMASEGGNRRVKFIPYLEEGEKLEPQWLKKLEKLGIQRLFLDQRDLDKAIAYLNNHLLLEGDRQAGSRKELNIMREHLNFSMQVAFTAPHLGHHVTLAKKSLEGFLGFLQKKRLSWKLVLEIMYQDYTLYNHSVNVAVLGMAVGTHLKQEAPECLVLGLAGLFHDLGMLKIGQEIIGKKEALTPEEWETLQKHPCLGYGLLKGNAEFPLASLRLVLEHHENADGSGYPQGLELSRQHPLTRILALLEAYDGLTIYRAYRPRHTPFTALKILQEERGKHGGRTIDPQTLKMFIEFLALT